MRRINWWGVLLILIGLLILFAAFIAIPAIHVKDEPVKSDTATGYFLQPGKCTNNFKVMCGPKG